MKTKTVKKLINNSYNRNKTSLDGYDIDSSLSGKRVQVYKHKESGNAVVVHRGTQGIKDWATDAAMAVGYERGKRFKHSKKIQKAATNKYGKENITTIGHSLGGRLAEKYHHGKNDNKGHIITLNKAATPYSIKKATPKNQTDVRSKYDAVSYLTKFQNNKNLINIKTKAKDPLRSHNSNILKELKKPEI